MSELKNLALFLIERVSVILHWLAASYWGILLAAILLVLALFWVWILEKVLKHKLAARCNVPAFCLSFGPISATVGWVMLGVGLFHVLLNVASRILGSGTGAYGPAGWVLGGLWLDDLVPVPYALGFPMAVAVYGYLYSVVLKARVEVVTGLNGPASAFVLALLCVPFLPISFVGSLAFRGVAKWWGRRELRKAERQRKKRKNGEEAGASGEKTDAADEAEGGGSAQEGVEKPPEEPVLPPPSLDGQPWTYLMVGHEVRYSDAHPALPFFRLLPRYKIAMNEGVTVAFAIVAALSIVSFFLPVTAEDVSFPDKRPFDAYKNTVSQIRAEENRGEEQGRKPLPLSPRPFDEVFPSLTVADVLQQLGGEMAKELPPLPDEAIQALEKLRDSGAGRTTINELLVAAKGKAASSLGVVLPVPARFALEKAADTFRVRLDVKDAEGLSAAYDCDGTTYDKLKEYVASRESGTELWARAVLNAALCRTVATPSLSFDAFRSLDAMLSDLTAAKLVSFQELELELADVREAARILGGTEDAARGWLLAGIIHKERRRVRDAQKLLGKAAAIWTDRPEDLAAGYLAVLEIADLLARLNRFGEAEDVLSDYASRVRSAAGDDRELIAFSKLVDIQLAALLARTYDSKAAVKRLKRAAKVENEKGDTLPATPLTAIETFAAGMLRQLEPEASDRRSAAQQFIFGPLPAGFLAGLLFFLLGLFRSLKTQEAVRERKGPGPRAAAEEEEPISEVPTETIVEKLQQQAAMDVVGPLTLLGKPGQGLQIEIAKATKEAARSVQPQDELRRSTEADFSIGSQSSAAPRTAIPQGSESKPPDAASSARDEAVPPPPDQASSRTLAQEGKPIIDFIRTLLRERGFFSGMQKPELYAHQALALHYVADSVGAERSTAVVLVTPANSGKTTAGIAAAMEAILERGMTALVICADERRMREEGRFFDSVRQMESWSWNLRAVVGKQGIDDAVQRETPIHLLYADVETVHRRVLPLEQQHLLFGFLKRLGLLVIEDLHAYGPAALAHGSFVLRRLSEVLAVLGARPVSLVTTMPVMLSEENLVRELLGPLAGHLRLIPAATAKAPEPSAHDYFVLRLRSAQPHPYPLVPVPHVAAAVIQAAGVPEGEDGQPDGATTWPAALVGYDADVPAADDRAVKIYYDMEIQTLMGLSDIEHARATLFPLSAAKVSWCDACTRHAGISKNVPRSLSVDEMLDAAGKKEAGGEKAGEMAEGPPHTSFLMAGPEPVDIWLADRFDELTASVLGGEEGPGTMLEMLNAFKPEWVIPRRNRLMNEYHFGCTLQERAAPGQSMAFLEDMFEADLLDALLGRAERFGKLASELRPRLDRKRQKLRFDRHVWAPREAGAIDDLVPAAYDHELIHVTDRTTHQRLGFVEKCRARVVYYPGRLFLADGVPMVVLAPRYQNAWRRDEWLCEPVPVSRRSSRIRRVSLLPEIMDSGIGGQWYSVGAGARFLVAFTPAMYREEVLGCRLFAMNSTTRESTEWHEAQTVEFWTETLLVGFGPDLLDPGLPPEEVRALLHGVVHLLRQVLPLVLRVDVEDLEISFGAGEPPALGQWVTSRTSAPIRAASDTPTNVPWISFTDRMDGGLGYARLLHERLLQGSLFPLLLSDALELAAWAAQHPEREAADAFRTSLCYEEDELELADPGAPEELLSKMLGRSDGLAASGDQDASSPAGEEGRKDGIAARRGLTDVFGLEEGENALARLILPEWGRENDSPWAMAFLCALLASRMTADERAKVERLAMAVLALRRRQTEDDAWVPPAGRAQLAQYKPDGEYVSLKNLPELTEGRTTALEEDYGRLARAMGLTTSEGKITQRGCALARALHTEGAFRQAFGVLCEAADGRRTLGSGDVVPVSAGLLRNNLPIAALRILADGLHEVPSVRRLGPAWRAALAGRAQPHTIDGQLATVAEGNVSLPPSLSDRFALISAYHTFHRALRTAVASLRVELSQDRRKLLNLLAEGKPGAEIHSALKAAAAELLKARDAAAQVPRTVLDFASALAGASSPKETLVLMLRRLAESWGPGAPLTLNGSFVVLSAGWVKKHAKDHGRGLLFRLNCLGTFLAETGWHEAMPRLSLDSSPVAACPLSEPIPQEWSLPATPPAGLTGEQGSEPLE